MTPTFLRGAFSPFGNIDTRRGQGWEQHRGAWATETKGPSFEEGVISSGGAQKSERWELVWGVHSSPRVAGMESLETGRRERYTGYREGRERGRELEAQARMLRVKAIPGVSSPGRESSDSQCEQPTSAGIDFLDKGVNKTRGSEQEWPSK